jgi:hypothetical protein
MKMNRTAKGVFKKTFLDNLKKELFSKYAGNQHQEKNQAENNCSFFLVYTLVSLTT